MSRHSYRLYSFRLIAVVSCKNRIIRPRFIWVKKQMQCLKLEILLLEIQKKSQMLAWRSSLWIVFHDSDMKNSYGLLKIHVLWCFLLMIFTLYIVRASNGWCCIPQALIYRIHFVMYWALCWDLLHNYNMKALWNLWQRVQFLCLFQTQYWRYGYIFLRKSPTMQDLAQRR